MRRRQIIEIKIRRQRKILQVSATLKFFKLKQLVQSLSKKQRKKHIRNKGLWAIVSTSYKDERFKQAFRVSRTTLIIYHKKPRRCYRKKKPVRVPYVLKNVSQLRFIKLVGEIITTPSEKWQAMLNLPLV